MLQPERLDPRRKSFVEHPPWFRAALAAMRGVDVPLPVLTGAGQLLGMARGRGASCDFVPASAGPYNSYDNLVATLTAATPQRFPYLYEKNLSGTPVINNWYDLWPLVGNPTQGTYPGAARTAVQWDDTATGAMYHGGNVSPQQKYLLSMMPWVSINVPRCWMLYDRVLTYEACTMTAASQAMTNVLAAQRYVATGEPGLRTMCTTQTAHNATAADLTVMNYVDNTGAAAAIPTSPANSKITGAVAPSTTLPSRLNTPSTATGSGVLRAPWLPLAAGTTGMRSITDYTWSAAPTGTNCFVLMYPLALVTDGGQIQFTQILDTVNSIGGAVRIYDGACIAMLLYTGINAQGRIFAMGDFGWTS